MRESDLGSLCGECLLYGAIQGLADGLILVDVQERIFHLNRRARQLLELGSGALAGRPVRSCLRSAGLERFWATAAGDTAPASTELSLPSGVLIRASVSLCISSGGETIGRALMLRDVTHERRLQVELTASVAERLVRMAGETTAPVELATLTAREREILELLGEGLTNAQIAGRLCLSSHTIASHLKHLYPKIRVSGRAQAAAWAAAHGLKPPGR